MAKVQKYSDSLLLEAVIKYADQYPGKIYASRLANWASLNVPGLEEVREYMFLRPLIVKDPKTGKQKQRLRPCTERIAAINASRTLSSNIKSNTLLYSSNIDAFFQEDIPHQRALIIQTRSQMDALIRRNTYLEQQNKVLYAENHRISSLVDALNKRLSGLAADQGKLSKQVALLLKTTDEEQRKKMLSSMGVQDGSFDLARYIDSLHQDLDSLFSISQTINTKSKDSYKQDLKEILFQSLEPDLQKSED